MSIKLVTLLIAQLFTDLTTAHAYVQEVATDDQVYKGFRPDKPFYTPSEPAVSWTYKAPSREFVNDYQHPDIICHKFATPASSHVEVGNGGVLRLLWSPWPAHHGPVITYLAACNGSCEASNKTALRFFKIDELGLLDSGKWALDKLIAYNNTWSITIPGYLRSGAYVLRHEVINLDNAEGTAQNYPQCINIKVTGDGTQAPHGVLGTELYRADDPGIIFDIYDMNGEAYEIPGPPLTYDIGEQSRRPLEHITKRSWDDFWKKFILYLSHSRSANITVANFTAGRGVGGNSTVSSVLATATVSEV
jgi:hypothetical protein